MARQEQLPLFGDEIDCGRGQFGYRVHPCPRGFIVSATAGRADVTVTLGEWQWSVAGGGVPSSVSGLVCTRRLTDEIAVRMCQPLFGNSRAANARVRHGTIPRTARSIHRRVAAEVKRLHDLVPGEVLATQRAVFAATFSTGHADWPELYEPRYAMLRRDIRAYRAAAAALHQGALLVSDAAEHQFRHSPEYAAARARAEAAGVKLDVYRPVPSDLERHDVLGRLADGWRGLFSPTGQPYRSLNRTLMNLPGGIPPGALARLSDLMLPRPVTDRVELLAVLAWYETALGTERGPARQRMDLMLHAGRGDIVRAMAAVSAATHTPLSPRRAADIGHAVGYMCDYPGQHAGRITGLARKAVAWHRETAARKAADAIRRLGGDKPAALPPVPLPDIPGITFLSSVGAIAEEGARMGNCVASYAARAVDGYCYLFHAEHGGETATIEVTEYGTVAQSEGPRNRVNEAARWGRRALDRWGRKFRQPEDDPGVAGAEENGVDHPWLTKPNSNRCAC